MCEIHVGLMSYTTGSDMEDTYRQEHGCELGTFVRALEWTCMHTDTSSVHTHGYTHTGCSRACVDTDTSTRGQVCAHTGIKCTCANTSRSVYEQGST